MELGSHWHDVLRERAEATGEGWIFEQAVADTLEIRTDTHMVRAGQLNDMIKMIREIRQGCIGQGELLAEEELNECLKGTFTSFF